MEDFYTIIIILSIVVYIALAAIPATIAKDKGYQSGIFFHIWFFLMAYFYDSSCISTK